MDIHPAPQGARFLRARPLIGKARYQRDAPLAAAPHILSCYRMPQWLWLPDTVLPDHLLAWEGAKSVGRDALQPDDLVFAPRRRYRLEDDDFGHVAIMTDVGTVIHATKWKRGVVEDPLEEFLSRGCLGIRRIPT